MATITNEAGLDPKQLETLKQKLQQMRAELASRRSGELRGRTDLASEVEDEGDAAVRANNEDTLVTLAEADHARLAEIDHALLKFEKGTYGLDEDSEEPIGFARLQVLPWARYGADTQERIERLEKRG
jgi:DnaK suppressor protein